MIYFIFDINTGLIDRSIECTSDMIKKNVGPLEGFIQAGGYIPSDAGRLRVKKGEAGFFIEELGKIDTRHRIDGLTVTIPRIPAGTKVNIGGEPLMEEPGDTAPGHGTIISDEDGVEIEFDTPGTYLINLTPPLGRLPETLEVTVG